MKQLAILVCTLCLTTVGFANANNNTPNKTGGEDNEDKLKKAHKQVALFNLNIFSVSTDTVSTISPFGNMDRFRKATSGRKDDYGSDR